MTATGTADRFGWLVDDLVGRVPGIAHAALLSADGLLVTRSRDLPPERAEQLAAIAAGLVSLAAAAARCLEVGRVTQTAVEMEHGLVLVMTVADGSSLVVLAASDCDLGLVGYEMTLLADRVGRAVTPAPRSAPEDAPRP